MAIKSIKDLPKGKRATEKQTQAALKAKPIERKGKVTGKKFGRTQYNFGKIKKEEAAGIVKGFRKKFKADFGALIKDKEGNVIARTHTAKGSSTVPEQLIVRALAKYGKKYDEIQLQLSVITEKKKADTKKKKATARKKATTKPRKAVKANSKKKPIKKAAKKSVKKPVKKTTKKAKKK